jgi:hypothetical protein
MKLLTQQIKNRMRRKIITPLFGILAIFFMSIASDHDALEAQVNTTKTECKALINECRYEGSKVTYYVRKSSKQTKSIELFMFSKNEYQIAIGAKTIKTGLTVKLYDGPVEMDDRILIKEFKNVQGTNFKVSTNDLNSIYRKKMPEVERLKNLHLEYNIASVKSDTAKEAIVIVYGNKAS